VAQFSVHELNVVTRAIGDPRRFEILQHIAATACMACSDLRKQFPISAATLSHHLKELESAGLIETEKRGKFVDAKFRPKVWKKYLAELKRVMAESKCGA
jgi:ArsR family transcriptional regulator, arsenate/arsenite/antimonite-responsive transcriptional repressor